MTSAMKSKFPDHLEPTLNEVMDQFRLNLIGPHGVPHWNRVFHHGEAIADHEQGVDRELVNLFAILHDSQREDDDTDAGHGPRAALYTRRLWKQGLLVLEKPRLLVLEDAIHHHSFGFIERNNKTIAACWDSDRLDIGRVGIEPVAAYLGTDYARREDVIEQAWFGSRPEGQRIAMLDNV